MRHRILIVEDDILNSKLLQIMLQNEGYDITVAYNGLEALEKFKFFKPHLVLLDITLPQLSGTEVLKRIRSNSDTPILILTAHVSLESKVRELKLGADDYVTKPFQTQELLARIQAVIRRCHSKSDIRPLPILRFELDSNSLTVQTGDQLVQLTPNEFHILSTLLQHTGKVITRERLVEVIDPHDTKELIGRTVDAHVSRLRKKLLGVGLELISTVRGIGYKAIKPIDPSNSDLA